MSLPPRLLHPLLDLPTIQHGFFTRHGGVSPFPYESLNVGQGSKDTRENIFENRRRVAAAFDQPEDRLLNCYQVHSKIAVTVDGPWPDDTRPEADGLVTTTPGLVIGALSADCAPLLWADPVNSVIGACHAGWKGALGGMIEAEFDALLARGADPRHLRVVVGPCIAQASYEVSADYEETFRAQDPDSTAFFIAGKTADKRWFDLPGFCLMRLKRLGLTQIAATGHDTCAEEALFHSNRRGFLRQEPDYGRLISAIMLRP
ncbi:peptidoglycan editing factor PgeF [Asticcacaulis sp. BYS171W]|uniref:Purine nucleoside phosphorylase n=1 Tax=Asticcacaulis aquaticus TaxID=2984212 RepID=A0ABT5HUT3_9CAUL|nr:peptidoglycan editing factor PgeF [Asticcacaulis aquaticus]MDC7683835.1 peptidoglycan editing factor PgeF [Asticcacaulis aquaticus]